MNKYGVPAVFRSNRHPWRDLPWPQQVSSIRASQSWRFDGKTKRWLPGPVERSTDWQEIAVVIICGVGFVALVASKWML